MLILVYSLPILRNIYHTIVIYHVFYNLPTLGESTSVCSKQDLLLFLSLPYSGLLFFLYVIINSNDSKSIKSVSRNGLTGRTTKKLSEQLGVRLGKLKPRQN